MAKIQMKTPLVEMDGDEMTRVLWQWIKDILLTPYVDLKTEYYDLGLEYREKTKDQVTVDSANATKKYGVAVKCATITPNAARMPEYNLSQMWKSPNGTIRAILDGTVFRTPILVKGVEPYIPTWTAPITIARHAYGDVYKNTEMQVEQGSKCELVCTDKDGKEVAHQTGATPGAAKLEDVDGNGVIDSKDRKVIGSKQPSFTMSMGNRFSYKDLYFSFLFNGVFGKWMTDNVANISSYTFGSGNYIHGVKYWTPETPDAEVVSPGYQASFSHGYYKKLNYVQLRNITLGYRVNQKFVRRIGLSAIDVNFSVNNVCAFSNMRQMLNYDNTWFASFPTARSYVLGLTLTF